MKEDERKFLIDVFCRCQNGVTPRDIINEEGFPIHYKRAWYLLDKWADKGWYDYGVTSDLGWLTDKGKEKASELAHNKRHEGESNPQATLTVLPAHDVLM